MTRAYKHSNPVEKVDIAVAINTDVSSATTLKARYLVGLITPAALDSTSITISASADGGSNFDDFYDRYGVQYSLNVGTDRYIYVDPTDFAGVDFIKLNLSTSETAARTITVVKRNID